MIEFRGKTYDICTLDFETHYAKDYGLRTMPTSAYIRDPRFLAQMVGMKLNDGEVEAYTYAQIKPALKAIDWRRTLLLCHNTAFDGFILTQHFKIRPAGYLDTLSMARAVLGHAVKHRLDNVGRLLGLGGKEGKDALDDAKGQRDLDPMLLARMIAYCVRDVQLCYDIFWKLYPHFPDDELELVDLTMRMFCEPRFRIDETLAREELEEAVGNRMRGMILSGASKADLMSNDKFVKLIQAAGGKVALKLSKRTGKWTPALAKTDQGMKDLLESPIEAVAELASARLGVKSTIRETRAQRFLDEARHGTMPVLLNYYGAATGRWSGGNSMNLQNLPRGGKLRRALTAPRGKAIVVADSGQIEARINAWLAGQADLLQVFRDYDVILGYDDEGEPIRKGPDPYRVMASKLFGVPIDQVTKEQRLAGKIVFLASGYNMGPQRLVDTLANAQPTPVHITIDTGCEWIDVYRRSNNMIARNWKHFHKLLPRMTMKSCEIPVGPITLLHEAMRLPNGMFIRYPGLEITQGDWDNSIGQATYLGRNGVRTKVFGGLLVENACQALARVIIGEQMLAMSRAGMRVLTMTHDEIVVLSSEKAAERTYKRMVKIMSTPPSWAPDLPLAASGGWAENYSK